MLTTDTPVPDKYKCAITHCLMSNPVQLVHSGKIYDKIAISGWIKSRIQSGHLIDPITGVPLEGIKSDNVQDSPFLIPLPGLKQEIDQFLSKNPSLQDNVLRHENDINNWNQLFQKSPEHIRQNQQRIFEKQMALRNKSSILFSRKPIINEEKEYNIQYNKDIILSNEYPIIAFAGSSRNGKSTLLNDILCDSARLIFEVDDSPDEPCTEGIHISLYIPPTPNINKDIHINIFDNDHKNDDEKKSELQHAITDYKYPFYVLDCEGLSHGDEFTKKLFYAVYGIADVIIWNDQQINSTEFKNFMKSIKKEMEAITKSDRKPSFIYLKRDKNPRYNFKKAGCNNFDEYINKHGTFKYLHDLKLFASINGYRINGRPVTDNGISSPFAAKQLTKLMDFIDTNAETGRRFIDNVKNIPIMIHKINQNGSLSLDLKSIMDDDVLRWFIYDGCTEFEKLQKMTFCATKYNWDHKQIMKAFNESMGKRRIHQLYKNDLFDPKVYHALIMGTSECVQRVKNKTNLTATSYTKWIATGAIVTGALTVFATAGKIEHSGEIASSIVSEMVEVNDDVVKAAVKPAVKTAKILVYGASVVFGGLIGAVSGGVWKLTRRGWVYIRGKQNYKINTEHTESLM